ncbi:hypothetical protein CPSG_05378 [Coccidioides posadasii str. Silveira]|uniref:Uncharacterized protein n=2 Tax=Coccidioides posadasii TaxID=199306 RepID=E9D782_COCPS|nr:hypothetical protein CPSG_05378 [Coccidioides posadasii str. Silveira]KMM68442.1 hypothetical protein CPAG_04769 [Coccidioides posadasii RMSCC 3488]
MERRKITVRENGANLTPSQPHPILFLYFHMPFFCHLISSHRQTRKTPNTKADMNQPQLIYLSKTVCCTQCDVAEGGRPSGSRPEHICNSREKRGGGKEKRA